MRWVDGITNSMDMSLSKLWGDGDGQGSLVSCSPWGGKELDMIERLNNNKAYIHGVIICINKPQSVVIK